MYQAKSKLHIIHAFFSENPETETGFPGFPLLVLTSSENQKCTHILCRAAIWSFLKLTVLHFTMSDIHPFILHLRFKI